MCTGGKDVWQSFKIYLKIAKIGQRRWQKARQRSWMKNRRVIYQRQLGKEGFFKKGVECDIESTVSKISDRSSKNKKNWTEKNPLNSEQWSQDFDRVVQWNEKHLYGRRLRNESNEQKQGDIDNSFKSFKCKEKKKLEKR